MSGKVVGSFNKFGIVFFAAILLVGAVGIVYSFWEIWRLV